MAVGNPEGPEGVRIGVLVLDVARGCLRDATGTEVALRPKAFELLRVLAGAEGRVLGRGALMDALWPGLHVTEDSLFQCVHEARRALGDTEGRLLRTMPRRGYRLEGADPPHCGIGPPDGEAGRTTLAVLRIADPGDDAAALARGLEEELVAALSRHRGLVILAGADGTSPAACGAVARYSLGGSLRAAPRGRLRVTLRLWVGATGVQLWADSFDGTEDAPFAFQERAARAAAAAVERQVMAAEVARARGVENCAAVAGRLGPHDLYLRALPGYWAQSARGKAEAVALLREAIARDPGHARALAALAHCRQLQATLRWVADADAAATEALELARRALDADRLDALVLATAGNHAAMLAGDHEQAAALAARALAEGTTEALVWTATGWISVVGGEPEEAIRRFRMALRLDPAAAFAARTYNGLAAAHVFAGRFAEAEPWAQRAVAASPDYGPSWSYLVASLALQGRKAEARAVATTRMRHPAARTGFVQARAALRHPWMSALLKEGLGEAARAG